MLTACKDDLSNPHTNCVREILKKLICYDHDQRRICIELQNMQNELKREMDKNEIRCDELRKPISSSEHKIDDFSRTIATIDEVKECFAGRIESLKNYSDEVMNCARQCFVELNKEKCKFKLFHERSVDYLKRLVIKSDDAKIMQKYETDICEMQKLFVNEVAHIRKCERELQSFLKRLQDCGFQHFSNSWCFKDYASIPRGKPLPAIEEIANDIKSAIGSSIVQALAQLHVQQPRDSQSFMASYLMNMERNENNMMEKLHLFGNIQ